MWVVWCWLGSSICTVEQMFARCGSSMLSDLHKRLRCEKIKRLDGVIIDVDPGVPPLVWMMMNHRRRDGISQSMFPRAPFHGDALPSVTLSSLALLEPKAPLFFPVSSAAMMIDVLMDVLVVAGCPFPVVGSKNKRHFLCQDLMVW